MPVTDQLGSLRFHGFFGLRVPVHDFPGFENVLLSQQEGSRRLFARLQLRDKLERAAGIPVVIHAVVAFSVQHRLRLVKAVSSQKLLPPSRIAGNLRACQAEEAFPAGGSVRIRIVEFVNLFQKEVVVEFRPCDELCVLHVHQVLGVKALRRQFRVSEYADLPRPVGQVLHADPPNLMSRAHGTIIHRTAPDPVVFTDEFGIARPVVAFGFILVQRLPDRLPAGAPEVTRLFIPQIDIPSGFVKLIEGIAEDPSGGPALDEAVSAGVYRNNRAVIR